MKVEKTIQSPHRLAWVFTFETVIYDVINIIILRVSLIVCHITVRGFCSMEPLESSRRKIEALILKIQLLLILSFHYLIAACLIS